MPQTSSPVSNFGGVPIQSQLPTGRCTVYSFFWKDCPSKISSQQTGGSLFSPLEVWGWKCYLFLIVFSFFVFLSLLFLLYLFIYIIIY